LLQLARRESEVCGVEEHEEVLAFNEHLEDGVPLLLGRVDASGVVAAWLHEHDCVVGQGLEVLEHAVEVQFDVLGVVVAITLAHPVHVLEHLRVVGPGRVGHGDLVQVQLLFEHLSCDLDGAAACDGLDGADAVEFGRLEVAEQEPGGSFLEFGVSVLGRVLVVLEPFHDQLLCLADDREHLGFSSFISLGSYA